MALCSECCVGRTALIWSCLPAGGELRVLFFTSTVGCYNVISLSSSILTADLRELYRGEGKKTWGIWLRTGVSGECEHKHADTLPRTQWCLPVLARSYELVVIAFSWMLWATLCHLAFTMLCWTLHSLFIDTVWTHMLAFLSQLQNKEQKSNTHRGSVTSCSNQDAITPLYLYIANSCLLLL